MTEGGDWDELGRASMWRGEIARCIHRSHIFRLRILSETILPEWVVLFVDSDYGGKHFQDSSKQIANLASIDLTQLRSCPLPPPLSRRTTPHRRQSRRTDGPLRSAGDAAHPGRSAAPAVAGGGGFQQIQIEGFCSLKDVVLEPGRLTLRIGPNGAGRSNLLQALPGGSWLWRCPVAPRPQTHRSDRAWRSDVDLGDLARRPVVFTPPWGPRSC